MTESGSPDWYAEGMAMLQQWLDEDGTSGLDVEQLYAMLPDLARGEEARAATEADIASVQKTTAFCRGLDSEFGTGMPHMAMWELQRVLPLLDATPQASELRSRLLLAVGDLALLTGWMCYDERDHARAWRLWQVALELSRNSDDPRGPDLTVSVILKAVALCLTTERPQEAQWFIDVARAVAEEGTAASTRSFLEHNQARVHAALGHVTAYEQTLTLVKRHFTVVAPAARNPWDTAVHPSARRAWLGHSRYELARTTGDPRIAALAVPDLRAATRRYPAAHKRTRVFLYTYLAGAHLLAGEVIDALVAGYQAADLGMEVSSPRLRADWAELAELLEPALANPAAAALCRRLTFKRGLP